MKKKYNLTDLDCANCAAKMEDAIKKIISDNVSPTDDTKNIDLIIYYQNRRTRDLFMKNNPSPQAREPLKQTHVVYQYTCPVRECSGAYVGMTTMRLSKRLSCHAQEGAIKNHARTKHHEAISRDVIIKNTKIIGKAPDARRLRLLEALLIQQIKPTLNTTQEEFLLPTSMRRPATNNDTTDHDNSMDDNAPERGTPAADGNQSSRDVPQRSATPINVTAPLRRSRRLQDMLQRNHRLEESGLRPGSGSQ